MSDGRRSARRRRSGRHRRRVTSVRATIRSAPRRSPQRRRRGYIEPIDSVDTTAKRLRKRSDRRREVADRFDVRGRSDDVLCERAIRRWTAQLRRSTSDLHRGSLGPVYTADTRNTGPTDSPRRSRRSGVNLRRHRPRRSRPRSRVPARGVLDVERAAICVVIRRADTTCVDPDEDVQRAGYRTIPPRTSMVSVASVQFNRPGYPETSSRTVSNQGIR